MKKGGRKMSVVRMTEGKIGRHLIAYSIPLILGNLFQLTYSAVDSVVMSRSIGKEVLTAMGTASPVMNIIILGVSGIRTGALALINNFFGTRDGEMVRKEMTTTVVFGFLFSLVVVALGIVATKPLLRTLQVSEEILGISTMYLWIIFLGASFTYLYNAVSTALKGVGGSKTPLRFLAFTSALSGLLDIIFIGGFRFGIVCSAVTTMIAEVVSATLCIGYMYRKIPLLRLAPSEFRTDGELLRRMLQYGGMAVLQQSCQSVGRLLTQGAVNTMGVDVVVAFSAVTRVDDFVFTPEQSISRGITTFAAQDDGTKKGERIGRGFRTGLILESGYRALIRAVILILRGSIMSLFVGKGEEKIVELRVYYLSLMAFFHPFPAFTSRMQGFFHGMGDMSVTLMRTMAQTGPRVIFMHLLTPSTGVQGIACACAIGWNVMLLVETPYCFYFMEKRRQDA